MMELGAPDRALPNVPSDGLGPTGAGIPPPLAFGGIGQARGSQDQNFSLVRPSTTTGIFDPAFPNQWLDPTSSRWAFTNRDSVQMSPRGHTSLDTFSGYSMGNGPYGDISGWTTTGSLNFPMGTINETGSSSATGVVSPQARPGRAGNNDTPSVEGLDPAEAWSVSSSHWTPSIDQDLSAVWPEPFSAYSVAGSSFTSFQSPPFNPTLHSFSQSPGTQSLSDRTPSAATAATTATTTTGSDPSPSRRTPNLYSKSNFDLLRALSYVATRKNPEVQLGAVDASCSFVVCDVTLNDCPIVYVSDNFQNLTGYSRHEILGKNCRFLQAPSGIVELGSKRDFVDNNSVYTIKQRIDQGREVQITLINYRKGGRPFENILTMVPIPWDTDEIKYIIGFQIDAAECPDAISVQGGRKVDYVHSRFDQYIWTPPQPAQQRDANDQTLSTDDVSALLHQHNLHGFVSDWHKQTWDRMLLENSDDVVHVLSMKGIFLYVSPASKKVLEYDSSELEGKPLASICHPSDIVPVTRELKEASPAVPFNMVFRICRKQSSYMWFESRGSLLAEPGRVKKVIILTGRKRPALTLRKGHLKANGGIGDNEIWTKLSGSGLFLFVSSGVHSLLEFSPEHLEGTSIQDLMDKESRPEFGRSMEQARRGKITSCKHEVRNKRGQSLQAQTTLYPGEDTSNGCKASFVLAQTSLLKRTGRARQSSVESTAAPASTHSQEYYDDAAADDVFGELKTTKCTSWQYELRQMEMANRRMAEEVAGALSMAKKRKRRKGAAGKLVTQCANCYTRNTPEWRKGPSGDHDLCNSCGLRWAKQAKSPHGSGGSSSSSMDGVGPS